MKLVVCSYGFYAYFTLPVLSAGVVTRD